MSIKLPVDAPVTIALGPAIDDTDFASPESVAYNAAGITVYLFQKAANALATVTSITPSNTNDNTHNYWAGHASGICMLRITAAQNNVANCEMWAEAVADGVLPFGSIHYAVNPDLSVTEKVLLFDPAADEVDIGAVKGAAVAGVNDFKATGFNVVVPPSVAQFNARTLVTADYFDPASDEVDIGAVKGAAVTDIDDFKADVSDLTFIKDVAEGDVTVDTSTTPWQLVIKRKSTAVVLVRKDLKQPDGTDVTAVTHLVGQQLEP